MAAKKVLLSQSTPKSSSITTHLPSLPRRKSLRSSASSLAESASFEATTNGATTTAVSARTTTVSAVGITVGELWNDEIEGELGGSFVLAAPHPLLPVPGKTPWPAARGPTRWMKGWDGGRGSAGRRQRSSTSPGAFAQRTPHLGTTRGAVEPHRLPSSPSPAQIWVGCERENARTR
uniref:Uncharacterized protein n=1 Tax=Oryza barthii TaxID=65489 RepID=A0A0D3GF75_9ORYZ